MIVSIEPVALFLFNAVSVRSLWIMQRRNIIHICNIATVVAPAHRVNKFNYVQFIQTNKSQLWDNGDQFVIGRFI